MEQEQCWNLLKVRFRKLNKNRRTRMECSTLSRLMNNKQLDLLVKLKKIWL